MRLPSSIVLLLVILMGCTGGESRDSMQDNHEDRNIPDHIEKLENLTVFSPDTQSADTVELEEEQVFESNKDVFINGYIGKVAVDKRDRVYITATKPGVVNIYVFDQEGNYLTSIGREGRGPGELESIGSISIENDQLYLFGPRLQKFIVYSLNDFSLVEEELINREKVKNTDTMAFISKGRKLFTTSGDHFLVKLTKSSLTEEHDLAKIFYYKLSPEGALLPGKLLEMNRYPFYFPKNGEMKLPFTMPFSRNSSVAITKDGSFFTSWTEDFLIKKYDRNGNYIRSFYYPVKKSTLTLDHMEIGNARQNVLKDYDIPDTWPALHTIELDDQGRLWAFSITDSDSTYKGWVLNKKGKLLARFNWPGKRASRDVMSKPTITIKNGYLYTRKSDIRKRIDQVVKYKINFKKQ